MTVTDDSGPPRWRQRGTDLSWREIDEEVIVLDLRSATYLRLNPAGGFLWKQLAPDMTHVELAALLAERFALDAHQAAVDTTAFLESCASKGLVERAQP